MKYKVIRTCTGSRGQYWEEGKVVELDDNERVPPHLVPIEKAPEPVVKAPHRTEAYEVAPGQQRKVEGGFGHGLEVNKIDRVMTVDKPELVRFKKADQYKKKDVGSATK